MARAAVLLAAAAAMASVGGAAAQMWYGMSDGFDDNVLAMTAIEGTVVVGGAFRYSSSSSVTSYCRLARWWGNTWETIGPSGANKKGVDCTTGTSVMALWSNGSTLYVGGRFAQTQDGTSNTRNVAVWNGTQWSALGTGVDGDVAAITQFRGVVYVGGAFQTAGGKAAPYLASWNGTWWAVGSIGATNGAVLALVSYGNLLYVGGGFTSLAGRAAARVGAWNGTDAIILTANAMSPTANVTTLAVMGTSVYAAALAPYTSNYWVSRWNTATSAWVTGLQANARVWALAPSSPNTQLYMAGEFTTVGSGPTTAYGVAASDGVSTYTAQGAGASNGVLSGAAYAVATGGNNIYYGGSFASAGGVAAPRVAMFGTRLVLPTPPPATNVDVSVPTWYQPYQTGGVNVSFRAPVALPGHNGNAYAYNVTVAPLDYTYTFSNASDLSDFVVDVPIPYAITLPRNVSVPPRMNGTISYDAAGGAIVLPMDTTMTLGGKVGQATRGRAPVVIRKLPENVGFEITANCSNSSASVTSEGNTTAACGIVIFDGAQRKPVLTWMITAMADGQPFMSLDMPNTASVVIQLQGNSQPWSTVVTLRMERAALPGAYVFRARDASVPESAGWSDPAVASVSVSNAAFLAGTSLTAASYQDLWYGFTIRSFTVRTVYSATATSSSTRTPTGTATTSTSRSSTNSASPTRSKNYSQSKTGTPSTTKSTSGTASNTPTRTGTPSGTKSTTPSRSGTPSKSGSKSGTGSGTPSKSGTPSQTPSKSGTPSNSPSGTPTKTSSPSRTPPSKSSTPTRSGTPSTTKSVSSTSSNTPTGTASKSGTTSPSQTATSSMTRTPTATTTPRIAVGSARFTNFRMFVGNGDPTTFVLTDNQGYSAASGSLGDRCVGGTGTVTVGVPTVSGVFSWNTLNGVNSGSGNRSWIVLEGLAGYVPYMVVVTTLFNGTVSVPSAPLPNIHFFARYMPPRSYALRFWLEPRSFAQMRYNATGWPLTPLVNARDSSGYGWQSTGANLSSVPRLVRTGDNASLAYLTFSAAPSGAIQRNLMRWGSDVLSFGIRGAMTVYVAARVRGTTAATMTTSTRNNIVGWGGTASTMNTATQYGWTFGMDAYSNVANGTVGMRARDTAGFYESASVKSVRSLASTPFTSMYVGMVAPNATFNLSTFTAPVRFTASATNLPYVPNGNMGPHTLRVCAEPGCTAGTYNLFAGGAAGMGLYNMSYPVLPIWQGTDQAQSLLGPVGPLQMGSTDVAALEGNVYTVLMYGEVHDAATRTAVFNWMGASQGGQCPQNISFWSTSTASSDATGDACVSGLGNATCTHYACRGLYRPWSGLPGRRTCKSLTSPVGSQWSAEPLVCRAGCDIPLPLSAVTCTRRLLSDAMDASTDAFALGKYAAYFMAGNTNFTRMTIQARSRVWRVDTVSGMMVANTRSAAINRCTNMWDTTLAPAALILSGTKLNTGYSWRTVNPFTTAQNVSADVMLADAASTVGFILRYDASAMNGTYKVNGKSAVRLPPTDANGYFTGYYWRVELSNKTAVNVSRLGYFSNATVVNTMLPVWAGVGATPPNVTFSAGVWHRIAASLSYSSTVGTTITITLDGVVVLSTTVLPTASPAFGSDAGCTTQAKCQYFGPSGAPGLYIAGNSVGYFKNVAVDVDCDLASQTAAYFNITTFDGEVLRATCPASHFPGTATALQCTTATPMGLGRAVTADGSGKAPEFTCVLRPPRQLTNASTIMGNRFDPDTDLLDLEGTPSGAFVGQLQVEATTSDQSLTFALIETREIVRGANWSNAATAPFSVSLCSGAITLNDGRAINANTTAGLLFNLTVKVTPSYRGVVDNTAAVNMVYMVTVTFNPYPPLFSPSNIGVSFDEHVAGGTLIPVAGAEPPTQCKAAVGCNRASLPLLFTATVAPGMDSMWGVYVGLNYLPYFALDPDTGALTMTALGSDAMSWQYFNNRFSSGLDLTLPITVQLRDYTYRTDLQTQFTYTVTAVNDMNSPPAYATGTVYETLETSVAANMSYVCNVMSNAWDIDDKVLGYISNPTEWYALNATFLNASGAAVTTMGSFLSTGGALVSNVFTMTPNGSVYMARSIASALVATDNFYYVFSKVRITLARAFFPNLRFRVCDAGTPPLCVTSTFGVVVLDQNNITQFFPVVTGLVVPPAGWATDGGEEMLLIGADFRDVDIEVYLVPRTGATLSATFCGFINTTAVSCLSPAGIGTGYTLSVLFAGKVANATDGEDSDDPLTFNYAPPRIASVNVTGNLTTDVRYRPVLTIVGANFGATGSAVRVTYGPRWTTAGYQGEFNATVTVAASGHRVITAVLSEGCGASLPVWVTVGGQTNSECADYTGLGGVPVVCTITFPAPNITLVAPSSAAAVPFNLTALSTVGGEQVVVSGTNLGPFRRNGALLVPVVTYAQGAGGRGYTYNLTACVKVAGTAHTTLACTTSPGVGGGYNFAINVCGQTSTLSRSTASYQPPTVTAMGGGVWRTQTAGGVAVTLTGQQFGPLTPLGGEPIPNIVFVRYGPLGVWRYNATRCTVIRVPSVNVKDWTMECYTAPGTGTSHWWQVNIGGQLSNVLPKNTSYGPPVVSVFSGGGADSAPTDAADPDTATVVLDGANFGFDASLIAVQYSVALSTPRKSDGRVPGVNGTVTFTPTTCTLTVPHSRLACLLVPGGGRGAQWSVTVDGQVSTQPSTAFAAPDISDVRMESGAVTASTYGGDVVEVLGTNFGRRDLVQTLTYGPSGVEFKATNYTVVSHSMMKAQLIPGVGPHLVFVLTSGDLVSVASTASIGYAKVHDLVVVPTTGPTMSSPPTLVWLYGYEFGLLNPDVEVEVLFGNVEDGTLARLPVVDRMPSRAAVTAPGFTPPVNRQQAVSFQLPASLGQFRAVRLLQYARGTSVSWGDIVALPEPVYGDTDFTHFSYADPLIDYISVTAPRGADVARVHQLFPSNANFSDILRLDIRGRNFGPPGGVDSVGRFIGATREIVINSEAALQVEWDYSIVAWDTWNHTQVVAFSQWSTATIQIGLHSLTSITPLCCYQYSPPYRYDSVSPSLSNLVAPAAGVATDGYVNTFDITVSGVQNTRTLNVTMALFGANVECRIVAINGMGLSSTDQIAGIIRDWYNLPVHAADPNGAISDITVTVEVPPGQGLGVPLQLWRDGAPSNNLTLDYAAPVITGLQYWDAATAALDAVIPFGVGAGLSNTFTIPTPGAVVAIRGNNFGLCPTVTIQRSLDSLVVLDACLPNGTLTHKVINNHHFIQFTIPEGEGTGLAAAPPLGWNIVLTVGNQGRSPTAPPLLLRYLPPVVTGSSVWASNTDGLTDGGAAQVTTISGANFGYASLPAISLVAPVVNTFGLAAAIPCTNATRVSHSQLRCVVPAGVGTGLRIRVEVAGQAGTGGNFTYYAPTVTAVEAISYAVWNASGGGAVNGSLWDARHYASAVLGADPETGLVATVTGSMHGGFVLRLRGVNFGTFTPGLTCPLMTPMATLPQTLQLVGVCNGMEDFQGEGEVARASIVAWGHREVAWIAPPGANARVLFVLVGGQLPPTDSLYASFRYATPVLLPNARRRGAVSTNGGDVLDLAGVDMPPTPINNATAPVVRYPRAPLPPWALQRYPTEHMRLAFGTGAVTDTCLTSALEATGATVVVLESCGAGKVIDRPRPAPAGDRLSAPGVEPLDLVSFVVPPGVGFNKSITMQMLAGGVVVAQVSEVKFSYDPPTVTRVEPRPLYDDGSSDRYITIHGTNFGRLADVPLYTYDEAILSVTLSDVPCYDPQRVSFYGEDVVQCRLPDHVPVGFNNVTVVVASQPGTAPSRSAASFQLVCAKKYFGHTGEYCAACPVGATCRGFVVDVRLAGNVSLMVDGVAQMVDIVAAPFKVNDVEYDLGGIHTYPVPQPSFFNLNGSMADACPPLVRAVLPGREMWIVGCQPKYAWNGASWCADGYVSKAPYYRCASCAPGYYVQAGDCIKCPDSPYMLFIGVGMLIMFVATLSYFLNKYQFDVRMTSIGIDYVQILSVFQNAKIGWPPVLLQIFHILSAFNFNIEIVAPECIVPDVSFKQKYFVILALPFGVLIMFGIVSLARAGYRYCIMRQGGCKGQFVTMGASISALLLLLFMLYLYVTKTIMAVWECSPTDPDDGKQYLKVVFEECGLPGGTQLTLMPYSIIGVCVIVLGYPVTVLYTLYVNRVAVMTDQMLRAMEMQPKHNTPAYFMRAILFRSYYQFKPPYIMWVGVLLGKKLCIALSALFFDRNAAFQMSMCLLVLFTAFGLQARSRPYMSRSDFDDVLTFVYEQADAGVPIYMHLRDMMAGLVASGKKATRRASLAAAREGGSTAAKLRLTLTDTLLNFNAVEGTLLVAGVLVCLLACMYKVQRLDDINFNETRGSITGLLVVTILGSVGYFVLVFVTDICVQASRRRAASTDKKAVAKRKKEMEKAEAVRRSSMLASASAPASSRFTAGVNPITGAPIVRKKRNPRELYDVSRRLAMETSGGMSDNPLMLARDPAGDGGSAKASATHAPAAGGAGKSGNTGGGAVAALPASPPPVSPATTPGSGMRVPLAPAGAAAAAAGGLNAAQLALLAMQRSGGPAGLRPPPSGGRA